MKQARYQRGRRCRPDSDGVFLRERDPRVALRQLMLRTRVRAGPIAGLVLSIVAAALFTLIHVGDLLVSAYQPELGELAPTTLRSPYTPRPAMDVEGVPEAAIPSHVNFTIPRGQLLDPDSPGHRTAVAMAKMRRPPSLVGTLGVFLIFFTLSMTLTSYLRKFGQNRLRLVRAQIGLFVAMGLMMLGSKLLLLFTPLPEFWIPLAAVPLWVATSFDRRTGFIVTVVLAFCVATLMRFDMLLLSVLLVRGMATILLYLDRKHPKHMLSAGVFGGLSTAALFVAMMVTIEGRFDVLADLKDPMQSRLLACLGGGVLSGVIGMMFRSPAERLMGNVPRERLLDLTDLEQPLLKKMMKDAPGSWEHSRAMANLAEVATSAIGGDALLTRVGAYYHDLGKSVQCKYFVENLGPGEKSPHDDLEPDVSADAIMAHVVLGTRILREGNIPEPVVEFAYTHHGTQLVEYFWNQCKAQGNPRRLDESHFRYPGMKPQTKETAILMLVDSIEAASRTVDNPDREKFETMVQRILFMKLKAGQLDESGLDMADLSIVVNRVVDMLVNMNHHRIKYQWQAEQAEQFGVPSEVMQRRSAPEIEVRDTSVESVFPGPTEAEDGEPPEDGSTEQPPPGSTSKRSLRSVR